MNRAYSRCSTNESKQDINRQVRELKAAGAEVIYMEYEHGDAKVKSQQQAMFAESEPGDTIIVLEVSRWQDPHSSYARSLRLSGRSTCGW